MNILVTGANGQLGLCFRDIVNNNGNGFPKHNVLDKNYWIFAGHNDLNITDEKAVNDYFHKNAINVVVNCAAYTNVDKAEEDEKAAFSINAEGPRILAEACKKVGAVLIHISTDYVFDGAKNTPYNVDDKCNPTSVYGKSKLLGENNIIKSGCEYLIFRTSWLFSEHGKNFVKKMFKKIVNEETVTVVYDQIGSPTSAVELANAIYDIITLNNADNRYLFKKGIYHFANKGVASWYDITMAIYHSYSSLRDTFSPMVEINACLSDEFKSPVKRPNYSVLDCKKTEEAFDLKISHWWSSLFCVTGELIIQDMNEKRRIKEELENTEFDYGHDISNREN